MIARIRSGIRTPRKRAAWLVAAAVSAALLAMPVAAKSPEPLAQSPTINATHVVFAHGGYLWSVPRGGGVARRLTDGGHEGRPIFSPDGKWIAYSARYDGLHYGWVTTEEVYVIAAEGGTPRRITWHPASDMAVGWTPDSRRILVNSKRESFSRFSRVYTVPVEGGPVEALPMWRAETAAYSPDAERVAYVPNMQWQPYWKRYRGGQTTPIHLARLDNLAVEKIPRDNSNDSQPVWVGDTVYFLSDREGPVTLFAYDTSTRSVRRLIDNDGLDLKWLSAGPGALVYEQFGDIYLFDPKSAKSRKINIRINETLPSTQPRTVSLGEKAPVISVTVSPKGDEALLEARGEIVSLPLQPKASGRNLTQTSGAAERCPSWSPDGKRIAWFSDASGEYALHLRDATSNAVVKKIALPRQPWLNDKPVWSPDSRTLVIQDMAFNLLRLDVESGRLTQITSGPSARGDAGTPVAWSPDSRWLAYSKLQPNLMRVVYLYSLDTGQSVRVSDPLVDARYPVFDKGGKVLVFAAGTDLGLGASWQEMSAYSRPVTRGIYAVLLSKDEPWPPTPEVAASVKVDVQGIERRIVSLPIKPANFAGIDAGTPGVLFLHEAPAVLVKPAGLTGGVVNIVRFDAAKGRPEPFVSNVTGFETVAGGEKVLYRQRRDWFVAPSSAAADGKVAGQPLDISQTKLEIDPRAEWAQMYREVWREQRDYFYAPNHHGLDFAAAEKRYAAYLPRLGGRADLNYLFQEFISGLTVGHAFVLGGDVPDREMQNIGLIGADYRVENGRYRFSRVFEGDLWDGRAQSPLAQIGVDVAVGDYLLAVNGVQVRPTADVYSYFEGTIGRPTKLTVGPNADGSSAREVIVTPTFQEADLRRRAWEEENRRTVERLSGGRLAYVHMPDTSEDGFASFNRFYFSQVGKAGAIIDARFNEGGAVADYISDVLGRPLNHCIQGRVGLRDCVPITQIYGPKTMLINEMQGSGGDSLPWIFQNRKIGPLVGRRTWGGLVGPGTGPILIDGGGVGMPSLGHYGLHGSWEVENIGISPDVEVENEDAALAAGRDQQLEKAVEVTLRALEAHPVVLPDPPAYPDYKGWKGGAR